MRRRKTKLQLRKMVQNPVSNESTVACRDSSKPPLQSLSFKENLLQNLIPCRLPHLPPIARHRSQSSSPFCLPFSSLPAGFFHLLCFVSFPPHHRGSTSISWSRSLGVLFPVPHAAPLFHCTSCFKGFCVITLQIPYVLLTSGPVFRGFSPSTGIHDIIPSYRVYLPVSFHFFVLPLDSLSCYTMNPDWIFLLCFPQWLCHSP